MTSDSIKLLITMTDSKISTRDIWIVIDTNLISPLKSFTTYNAAKHFVIEYAKANYLPEYESETPKKSLHNPSITELNAILQHNSLKLVKTELQT